MTKEQQVTNLELSKKLKELGVPQDSLFKWWATDIESDGLTWWEVHEKEPRGKKIRESPDKMPVSAFTVAELGEMLPIECQYSETGAYYWVYFQRGNKPYHEEKAETEADARAKMLIWLIENKYIYLRKGN
jgi:hypothetical protein